MKTIPEFLRRKAARSPITMATCYDAATAKILNDTSVDALLVGDSCAMVVHGYDSTVHATVEMMASHTAAVRRGSADKVIISDLPFLSYRGSDDVSTQAVSTLMRAGANGDFCRTILPVLDSIDFRLDPTDAGTNSTSRKAFVFIV